MEVNMLEDLSKFSGIPQSKFENLSQKIEMDICQCVREYLTNCEEQCKIDLGFGDLLIKQEDDEVLFKFVPSLNLCRMIESTLSSGKSPLRDQLECTLTASMLRLYKELL